MKNFAKEKKEMHKQEVEGFTVKSTEREAVLTRYSWRCKKSDSCEEPRRKNKKHGRSLVKIIEGVIFKFGSKDPIDCPAT